MADDWTTGRVQDRLELAADVFAQLPGVKPTGYFNAWPEYFHSFADHVGQEPETRRPRPTPRQITEAEEAMLWLRWLERDDARIVWLRARGKPWKKITWEIGLSRPAANRHWQYGVALITWRLHGRMPSSRRSKRFVIDNADNLSRKIIL
ncbi:DUF6362 family protein [Roseisalinus antarcticus]|jgi:hypothetical protein|uniref:DUF6362 domain-containing protein n=1 Tax=Roseisalinus antarcticus TaxID=254357 RepID=A0A1Y5U2Z4_9RHOB|nr:DUF6362 family protein [Roseisalinus antarcticus]SLN77581.1 hypothetical protein ROA7023_04444 [Roseisalinus antarcticus]